MSMDAVHVEAGRKGLPWTQVHNWVLLSGVPARSLAAYVFLKAHVNSESGTAYPGTARLATYLGLARSDKVAAVIRPLVAVGAVTVERRGVPARNVYVVHDVPPDGYDGPLSVSDWSAANAGSISAEREANRTKTLKSRQSRECGDHSAPVTPPNGEQGDIPQNILVLAPVTPPGGEQGETANETPVTPPSGTPVTPPGGELLELDLVLELDLESKETTSLHSPAGEAAPRQLSGRPATPKRTRTRKPKPAPVSVDDPRFAEFWSAYPRKIAKLAAVEAWGKAIASGATPADITAGARHYAAAREGQESRYTAHPATWLNQMRWTDQPDAVPDGHGTGSGRSGWSGPYKDPVIPDGVDPAEYWTRGWL